MQVKNNFLNISIKINIFFLTNINFPISILYICTLTLSIHIFFFCKANKVTNRLTQVYIILQINVQFA